MPITKSEKASKSKGAKRTLSDKKRDLINEIKSLNDEQKVDAILEELAPTKETSKKERVFGSGKHVFTYISDDFNDPIEEFKDYM